MPYPISAVHSRRFVAAYADRMRMLFGASLIGYWPLWEASGVTANDISPQANNGAYSNVTLAQAGIGDGRTSASFVAASKSSVNIYSVGLVAAVNPNEGTWMVWAKMSGAGVWTDGVKRVIVNLGWWDGADINQIQIYKWTDNNSLGFGYFNPPSYDSVGYTTTGPLGWMHLTMTWSQSAGKVIGYYNGSPVGTDSSISAHGGGSMSVDTQAIGTSWINAGATDWWSGLGAHAILLNRAATAPEIAEAARASV